MPEWLNGTVLKTVIREIVSGVRIPEPPQNINCKMGKFYEDLDTLNELIKKLDKKNQISEFIIKSLRHMKENPSKSISDVIKETKKEHYK